MKTYSYLAVLLAVLFIPSLTTAQTSAGALPQCPHLQAYLEFGASDDETRGQVSALQRYLTDFYHLPVTELVTGYFGVRTRENLRRFQCDALSLCSGDEDTTGYGAVGPRTRAAIAARCSNVTNGAGANLERSTAAIEYTIPIPSPRTLESTQAHGAVSGGTPSVEEDDFSCTINGVTVRDGSSTIFYSAPSVVYPNTCTNILQARTCSAGVLFGSSQYQYASCAVNGAPPRTDGGASSSATDNTLMRYYEATPSGASASTQPPTLDRTGAVVTCSYNGTMYMEGRSVWIPQSCRTLETSSTSCGYYMTCGRSGWANGAPSGSGSASCTFENTSEGALCGGQYHCGFGVSGHLWSSTACTPFAR